MASVFDVTSGETIPFGEILETQDFQFSGNVFTLRRTFQCPWESRFKFIRAMMGVSRINFKNTGHPTLERVSPVPFADLRDTRGSGSREVLYPTGVERIVGTGPRPHETQGPPTIYVTDDGRYSDPRLFVFARVTMLYEAPTFSVQTDNDCPIGNLRDKPPAAGPTLQTTLGSSYVGRLEQKRYTTRITQPLTEAIRIPANYWQYVEGLWENGGIKASPGQLVDIGTYVLFPTLEVQWHFHRVPALVQSWETGADWLFQETANAPTVGVRPELLGACFTHLGCVNARYFDGFAPGTLLLTAIEARPYRWITGERYYDYTFRAKHFNPVDAFKTNMFPFVYAGTPPIPTETRDPAVSYPYAGHNYFLRLSPPKDNTISFTMPYFSLITDNGQTLENNGRPVFPYRDFEDLFVPYNRAHMQKYYAKTTLTPLWTDPGT